MGGIEHIHSSSSIMAMNTLGPLVQQVVLLLLLGGRHVHGQEDCCAVKEVTGDDDMAGTYRLATPEMEILSLQFALTLVPMRGTETPTAANFFASRQKEQPTQQNAQRKEPLWLELEQESVPIQRTTCLGQNIRPRSGCPHQLVLLTMSS